MKICKTCGVTKCLSDFGYRKRNKDGISHHCKVCINKSIYEYRGTLVGKEAYNGCVNRYHQTNKYKSHIKKRNLKRKYNITIEEYNTIFQLQNGMCAICGTNELVDTVLHVDHCHNSGKVRGLLCLNCNAILGYAKDNTSILMKAIQYLQISVK